MTLQTKSQPGPPPGVVWGPRSGGPALSLLLDGGCKKQKNKRGRVISLDIRHPYQRKINKAYDGDDRVILFAGNDWWTDLRRAVLEAMPDLEVIGFKNNKDTIFV